MSIRVLVVDDSAFMRKIISDMVNSDPDMTVVGTARNGEQALEAIGAYDPDVITMDVEMPGMDGLTALENIMVRSPLPVIMMSSLTVEGARETLKALDLGAFDFVTKPSSVFKVSTPEVKEELLSKIRVAKGANVSQMRRRPTRPVAPQRQTTRQPCANCIQKLIAIGTSTGGPRALQEVIPLIPENIPAAVFVVQHMPPGFTKSLAERLDGLSKVRVKEADDGEIAQPGTVYLAPGDKHLRVIKQFGNFVIQLDGGEKVSGHRPSADALFDSISSIHSIRSIGVIMTGMGSDGAKGLSKMHDSGHFVIAQDEASSVVYGMPKSAVRLGAVDKTVDLLKITAEIMKAMEE